ncbi:MAG TPA: hypothetical protein VGD57_00985 [Candidatus Dormibacteraeota bacterium]
MLSQERQEELAEGEEPSTTSRDVAERWLSVYTELTELEDDVIKSVKDRLPRMSPEARRETERTNLPALEEDAKRFHARLRFWRQRLAEL